MISTLLAQRYAQSLLECAADDGIEDGLMEEALALAEALEGDRDVRRFLIDPISSPDEKLGVLLGAFSEPPLPLMRNFLRVAMENHRERFLPQMLREFLRLVREKRGEISVQLTSAAALDSRQLGLMEAQLGSQLNRKVELVSNIDHRLLGGAVLKIGDMVYDGSLRHSLERLEMALKKEPVHKAPRAKKSLRKPAGRKKTAKKAVSKKTKKPKAVPKKRKK